jgi:hypothetical protein
MSVSSGNKASWNIHGASINAGKLREQTVNVAFRALIAAVFFSSALYFAIHAAL